ncbi:MAG: phosphoglycerate mutase [Rhodanobacter sp.]
MTAGEAPTLHLWLPARQSFEPGHPLLQALRRADRLGDGASGYLDRLGEFFDGVDAHLPAAAITRDFLVGDASDAGWLSADPAWVQPDMTGARLVACGRLQLDLTEAQALAAPLQPVFADADMELLVSSPDRWHVRLPPDVALPDFVDPEQAMGEDLSQHLPAGAQGRKWRVLINEIQVLLHQHPLNTQRRARGVPPVNSLWFWGGGHLPSSMHSILRGAISDDVLVRALAARAGIAQHGLDAQAIASASPGWLLDLQDLPGTEIASTWQESLQPCFDRHVIKVYFASGERWLHRPWHRWRFWRGSAH